MFFICSAHVSMTEREREATLQLVTSACEREAGAVIITEEETGAVSAFTIGAEETIAEKIEYCSTDCV